MTEQTKSKTAASGPVIRRYYNAHGVLVRRIQFPGSRLVFYIDRLERGAGRWDFWPRFGASRFRMACPSLQKAIRALRLIDHLKRGRSELERRDG